MVQFWLRWLCLTFLAGLWLSLEVVQCQTTPKGISNLSYCYNKSSGTACFTTFLAKNGHPVRKTFKAASDWCQTNVSGSSLIIIKSLEDQRTVESFIGRQTLVNETIVINARKLSPGRRREWSWVNGHKEIPTEVSKTYKEFHYGACVVFEVGRTLAYRVGNVTSAYHYICEYSDLKRGFNYQRDNKYYVVSTNKTTWYEARSECLRLGGDLASLTDLESINGSSWLMESRRYYWIGLHRNQWIWNRTGVAITYTNWEGGYPDDSPDMKCICISPKCSIDNNRYTCKTEDDRKWWACNCNDSYAFVCQTDTLSSTTSEDSIYTNRRPVLTTTTSNRSSMLSSTTTSTTTTTVASIYPSTLITTLSSTTTIPIPSTTTPTTTKTTTTRTSSTRTTPTPVKTTTTPTTQKTSTATTTIIKTTTTTTTQKTSSATFASRDSPINKQEPSTGLFNAMATKEILLIVLLFVAVVFIVIAVIVVLRKRKYARRNEGSSPKETGRQTEPASSEYASVVPRKGPLDDTDPPSNTIYAEVELIQRPKSSNNATIYASVQPSGQPVEVGNSVIYADLDFPQKAQQKPKSADKISSCLSPVYSTPYKPSMSDSSAVYAEPYKPDKPLNVHI